MCHVRYGRLPALLQSNGYAQPYELHFPQDIDSPSIIWDTI
jgi:hypothetical protein